MEQEKDNIKEVVNEEDEKAQGGRVKEEYNEEEENFSSQLSHKASLLVSSKLYYGFMLNIYF